MSRVFPWLPALLWLAGCAGATDSSTPSSDPSLGFSARECWFNPPPATLVECGILRVREDREDRENNRTMEIPVVQILPPAAADSGAPPAVILGGGGPGGRVFIETPEEIAFWNVLRRDILGENGRIIIAEQRGAGLSRPSLKCPEVDSAEMLSRPLSLREEARILREDLEKCAARLSSETNLSAHTTAASADDFAELRRALDIPKWDLIGFSYGSRVAFELLERDPDGARAVVMDAAVPPRRDPELEGENVARILDELSAECAADAHCAKRGELRENLNAAAARLAKTPAILRVRDPRDGGKMTVALNRRRFADLIFLNLYDEQSAARLPKLARQFARGQTNTDETRFFLANYLEFILDSEFADALYLTVVCRESPRPSKAGGKGGFPEGDLVRARLELFSACDDFFTRLPPPPPPRGGFPVLMMAGEYDVAAPPQWARNAAAKMTSARVTVFPTAHISLLTIPCARQTARAFLQNPKAPLNECVKKTRRLTFH